MYSVRGSMPPLLFSSVEDERKHMLLLHCPLSSEYVQGAELGFSFLVDTEIKKQSKIIAEVIQNTESWLQFYNAHWKVYFPKVLFLISFHQCVTSPTALEELFPKTKICWFCSTAVVWGLQRNSKSNISLKKVKKRARSRKWNYKSFLIKGVYNKMKTILSLLMHKVFL